MKEQKQKTKKSYKKNDNNVKYYFSDKKGYDNTFFDLSISSDKISELYNELVKKYGEIDIIKDYSIYKYDNECSTRRKQRISNSSES